VLGQLESHAAVLYSSEGIYKSTVAVAAARLVVTDEAEVARRASWAAVVAQRYGNRYGNGLYLVDARAGGAQQLRPNRWTAAAAAAAAAARFARASEGWQPPAAGDDGAAAPRVAGATLRCELLATHPRHADARQEHGVALLRRIFELAEEQGARDAAFDVDCAPLADRPTTRALWLAAALSSAEWRADAKAGLELDE